MKTLLVTVICFAAAAGGGVLLYRDINNGGVAGQGAPMAKIEKKESKVRRKASASYSWNNVQKEENLYRKDSVQTGAGSAAVIRLNDGAMLELGENSLVVIDDLNNLALNPVKGNLVLRTQSGDSRITIGADGKMRIEELPMRLTSPESLAVYFSAAEDKNKEISFAWDMRAGSVLKDMTSPLQVEISKDKSFKSAEKVSVTDFSKKNIVSKLTVGKYFWRITQNGQPMTETNQFRVAGAIPLKATLPSAQQKVSTWEEDPTVQFKWAVPQSADIQEDMQLAQVEHRIEVSPDPTFKNVSVSQVVNAISGLANVKELPLGNLYWRVKSKYGDVDVVGNVERFSTERAQKLAIDLTFPKDQASIELQPQLRFSWAIDNAPSTLEYEVEIAKSDDTKVETIKTNVFNHVWKAPKSGAYKWRVLAKTQQDKIIGESQFRTFSIFTGAPIALVAPQKDSENFWWDRQSHFEFEWKNDPLVKDEKTAYMIEVAKDTDFKEVVYTSPRLRRNQVSTEDLKLQQFYDHFWRVKIVDPTGQSIKISDGRKFSYGLHPVLKAPTTAKPPINYSRNIVEDISDLELSWSEVKLAEGYEVVVYEPVNTSPQPQNRQLASNSSSASEETFGKIIFKSNTEKLSVVIPSETIKRIPAGQYRWTVRAIDRLKRKGEMLAPHQINFEYGEVLSAPSEFTTPEVQ